MPDPVICAGFVFIVEARTTINGKWAPLTYACGNSEGECRELMKQNRARWHELKEQGVFDKFRCVQYDRGEVQ